MNKTIKLNINNIVVYIGIFICIIVIGIILGLSVIYIIDKRLSNIAINIPDQHIYLNVDDNNIKLNKLPNTPNNITKIKLPIQTNNIHESFDNQTSTDDADDADDVDDVDDVDDSNTNIQVNTDSANQTEQMKLILSGLSNNISSEIDEVNLTNVINTAVKNAIKKSVTDSLSGLNTTNSTDESNIENFYSNITPSLDYFTKLYSNNNPQKPMTTGMDNLVGYNISSYNN
jgi:hypothetical protein